MLPSRVPSPPPPTVYRTSQTACGSVSGQSGFRRHLKRHFVSSQLSNFTFRNVRIFDGIVTGRAAPTDTGTAPPPGLLCSFGFPRFSHSPTSTLSADVTCSGFSLFFCCFCPLCSCALLLSGGTRGLKTQILPAAAAASTSSWVTVCFLLTFSPTGPHVGS